MEAMSEWSYPLLLCGQLIHDEFCPSRHDATSSVISDTMEICLLWNWALTVE